MQLASDEGEECDSIFSCNEPDNHILDKPDWAPVPSKVGADFELKLLVNPFSLAHIQNWWVFPLIYMSLNLELCFDTFRFSFGKFSRYDI